MQEVLQLTGDPPQLNATEEEKRQWAERFMNNGRMLQNKTELRRRINEEKKRRSKKQYR